MRAASQLTRALRPFSLNPTGTLLRRHLAQFVAAVDKVTVLPDGFLWQGKSWPSLSAIAFEITGTKWNGPRFFGVGQPKQKVGRLNKTEPPAVSSPTHAIQPASRGCAP